MTFTPQERRAHWTVTPVIVAIATATPVVRKIHMGYPGPWPVVDLTTLSCTCRSFVERRSLFDVGTPARLCSCIKKVALRELGAAAPEWLLPLAEDTWSRSVIALQHWRKDRRAFYLGVTASSVPFVSVYVARRRAADQEWPGSGPLGAYRLQKEGTRWAYGNAPFGAPDIKLALEGSGLWRRGV